MAEDYWREKPIAKSHFPAQNEKPQNGVKFSILIFNVGIDTNGGQ